MSEIMHYENGELSLQGFKNITSVQQGLIAIDFNHFTLHIHGKELRLSYFSLSETCVKGKIESIKVIKNEA